MSLAEQGYDDFVQFLEKSSGIYLGSNKQYLVTSRLRGIMKELKLESLQALMKALQSDTGQLRNRVVDAMTTNETLWFRDQHPFEILDRVILPEHFQNTKGGSPIRIWSAACSTGQEPYSISMIMEEYVRKTGRGHQMDKIVATDISKSVLEEAKLAEYAMLSLGRGLDADKIKQYFDQIANGRWKIKPSITRRVEFRPLNLKDSYSALGKFDVVFCRNVLIYFTADLKKDILSRIHATLKPGGYLIVGSSEAVNGLQDKFEMVHCRPGIMYRAI